MQDWLPRSFDEDGNGSFGPMSPILACENVAAPADFSGLGLTWIASVDINGDGAPSDPPASSRPATPCTPRPTTSTSPPRTGSGRADRVPVPMEDVADLLPSLLPPSEPVRTARRRFPSPTRPQAGRPSPTSRARHPTRP